MQPFKIPAPSEKPLVIAEIALAHDGSLGNAIAYIRACAEAGADAVKFQCHDGDPNDEWREGLEHPQDVTRQDYWRRTAFDAVQWETLRNECHRCGVWFGVTPFSEMALGLMIAHAPDFLKIARQHAHKALHAFANHLTQIPVVFTGDGGLGLDTFGPKHIGISCHAPSIAPSLDAARRGSCVIEKHICWDRRQFGPDTPFSIAIDELEELCASLAS